MNYLKKRKIIAIVLAACVFIAQLQPALAITSVEKASRDKKTLDEIGITQFATIINLKQPVIQRLDMKEKNHLKLKHTNIICRGNWREEWKGNAML